MRTLLCLIAFAMTAVAGAEAQNRRAAVPAVDSAALVRVRLVDGSELLGHIVAKDDTSLTVNLRPGSGPWCRCGRWPSGGG